MSDDTRKNATRHLDMGDVTPMSPKRGTGPLDYLVPWVVEMRVIGTASMIHSKLERSMSIGRGDKASGKFPDIDFEAYNGYYLGVSREHAIISAVNSRVTIRDLGSSNGTFINGMRLSPNKEYQLRHGDQLSFGKLALQVSFVVTPSSHEKNDTAYSDIEIPRIGTGQQVMVVDDDEQVAQTIGVVLTEAGFKVKTVANVTDAITVMNDGIPHAIVMELMLPDRNGLELVHYVRAYEKTRNLPIVVVSGVSGGYHMGQAIEAGVDLFLTKPVGVDELIRGFSKVVAQMNT